MKPPAQLIYANKNVKKVSFQRMKITPQIKGISIINNGTNY
jgi:hypothetical protein